MATCLTCGSAVPDHASFCPACGAALTSPGPQQPAAAPSPLPQAAAAALPAYASLGDRLLAVVLDGFILVAVFWAAGSWIAPRYGGVTSEGFNLTGAPALIVMGLSSFAFLAYYLCFEWWWGATLGKMLVGVKVSTADGGPIDFRRSLVRNLLRVVDGIGVYLVAGITVLLTKRRQRVGDLAAGTTVTKHDYPRYCRVLALIALLALPVATIAATWFWRAAPASETTSTGVATSTSASTSSGPAAATSGGSASGGQATTAASATLPDVADGPFMVTGLRLAAGKDGPDRPDATFKAGDTPTLVFEVQGFAVDQSQQGRVKLTIAAHDPEGVPINEPRETEGRPPATVKSLESWANVSLPSYAVPGEYRLDITVADVVGNRKVAVSAPFRVTGVPFEPSAALVLRNVRLTEGEDGPARSESRYAAGGTVWIAFEVVGFKAGTDKSVRVQEHLTVTSASGAKVLDAQVLDLNRQFFYVPKQLPLTNHITLGQMPAGDYQATFAVTDVIGGQRCEQVVRFTIQ
jgi:uncharacterized RDD family membrane protein YckC